VISEIRRQVDEKSALLRYYAASSSSLLTRFWEVYSRFYPALRIDDLRVLQNNSYV